MQGVYEKPKSKKEFKEMVAHGKGTLMATSVMGNEYDGPVKDAPDGTYYVVGPDPYNSRKWYAQVRKSGSTIRVS